VSEPLQKDWRLVSPKYIVEAFISTAGFLILPLGFASVPLWIDDPTVSRASWYPLAVMIVVSIVALALVPRRVRAIGYQLRADDLLFRRGILYRRQVAAPYGRLQLVDVSRGPVSRLLGLSELRLVTAAATTGVTIPGLPQAEAEELRDHLISVAESRRAGL
jgi:membrane protein YdbS with pleckstrin-like domain